MRQPASCAAPARGRRGRRPERFGRPLRAHVVVLELVLLLRVEDDAVVVDKVPDRDGPVGPLEKLRHRVEEPDIGHLQRQLVGR